MVYIVACEYCALLIPLLFSDLQMKPYRTDEYVHKLFYETSRFSAFNHQWAVKARINNSQRDPHTVNERQITYQVKQIQNNINVIVFSEYSILSLCILVDSKNKNQRTAVYTLFRIKRSILRYESKNTNL